MTATNKANGAGSKALTVELFTATVGASLASLGGVVSREAQLDEAQKQTKEAKKKAFESLAELFKANKWDASKLLSLPKTDKGGAKNLASVTPEEAPIYWATVDSIASGMDLGGKDGVALLHTPKPKLSMMDQALQVVVRKQCTDTIHNLKTAIANFNKKQAAGDGDKVRVTKSEIEKATDKLVWLYNQTANKEDVSFLSVDAATAKKALITLASEVYGIDLLKLSKQADK